MAELWGAPNGIIAADELQRKNFLSGLEAQKVLLDVQKQPYEIDKLQADAAHQRALAGVNALTAIKAQRALATDETLRQASVAADAEIAAREKLVAEKAAQGTNATVADLGADGKVPVNSATARTEEMIRQAVKRGASEMELIPLRKELSLIYQQDASAAHSRAQAFEQQMQARGKQQDEYASLANYMKKGPKEYAAGLQQAMQIPGLNLSKVPPVWSQDAVRMLDAVTSSVVKEKDRIDLQIKQQTADAATLRAKADQARAGTDAMVAGERVKLMRARRDKIEAELGDGSSEKSEATRALTQLRDVNRDAKLKKDFPPAPIDPTARRLGQTYTAANGTRFIWENDPRTNKPVARVIAGGKSSTPDDDSED